MTDTPTPGAQTTTLQVMSYNAQTDAHTLVLDLNDHAAFTLRVGGLVMAQPAKADSRSSNLRVPGERVVKWQYKNRHITAQLNVRALTPADSTSTTQLLTDIRNLLAAVEHPPYELRIALPKATQYSYADVVQCTHTIPSDPQEILAGAIRTVAIDFECLPGLRGDRLTLQNLVFNPGFEAPSGPAVTAFADTFANFNAYTVQAGGALTQDSTYYADVVLADSPIRYYRLDESSGTTSYDAGTQQQNGTTHGSPTQGVTGLLASDPDTCYTFASASSQYVSASGTGLPTGAGAFTVEAWVKFASNPAANAYIASWGNATTANLNVQLWIDTSGMPRFGTTGTAIAGTALSTGTAHHIVATYDGANLRLYADGSLVAGPTAATLNIPSGPSFAFGAAAWSLSGTYFNGQIDEGAIYATALSSTRITAHYNAGHSAPVANQASTMVVPSGGRISFGSPAWVDVNTWQVRFRYASSLTANFYLHYTDANNYLLASVTQTSLTLTHLHGGVTQTLGTAITPPHLVPGVPYWLKFTQFPQTLGGTIGATAQVQLFLDAAGAISSTSACSLVGPVTGDGGYTLIGYKDPPQIAASGAALALGGSSAIAPHRVQLFRPGAWSFTNAGTGLASLGVDTSTTYTGGPVSSFYAARVDAAPAGTLDAKLQLYTGGAAPAYGAAGTWGIPVNAATDVLSLSAWAKTSAGFGSSATLTLVVTEYNSSGTSLRSNVAATLTGPHTTWTQLSASYTTGANCAYVDLTLRALDSTSGSVGQQVWWDNVQVWDKTSTGQTSMPYCALRFPQAPAQVMVSGLVGDMEAPILASFGGYLPGSPWTGSDISLFLGRAATYQPTAQWIGNDGFSPTLTLDTTAYGGYTCVTSNSTTSNIFTHSVPAFSRLNGTYHLWARFKPQTTASGIKVQTEVVQLQTLAGGQVTGVVDGQQFTASLTLNVPAILDGGQVQLPGVAVSTYSTKTSILEITLILTGSTVMGTVAMNWLALMPVDSAYYALVLDTLGGVAPSSQWLYFYVDGLAQGQGQTPSATTSIENTPTANPAVGFGGPGITGNVPVLNPSADYYVTVDPTLTANQFLAIFMDDAGDVFPVVGDITYVPLYLYPR